MLDLKKCELTEHEKVRILGRYRPDAADTISGVQDDTERAARAKTLLGPDGIVAWLRFNGYAFAPEQLERATIAAGLEWPMKEAEGVRHVPTPLDA